MKIFKRTHLNEVLPLNFLVLSIRRGCGPACGQVNLVCRCVCDVDARSSILHGDLPFSFTGPPWVKEVTFIEHLLYAMDCDRCRLILSPQTYNQTQGGVLDRRAESKMGEGDQCGQGGQWGYRLELTF